MFQAVTIIIPLILLAVTALATIFWACHWFTYRPYADVQERGLEESRALREGGGLWRVATDGYEVVGKDGKKVSGYKGKAYFAKPIRGILGALRVSLICLFATYISAVVLQLLSYSYLAIVVYTVGVICIMVLVFPETFVHKADLPGRLLDFDSDIPELPMFGGLMLSLYGMAVVAKHVYAVDCMQKAIDFLQRIPGLPQKYAEAGPLGIPILLCIGLFGFYNLMVKSRWGTCYIFGMSLLIYLVTTLALGWWALK